MIEKPSPTGEAFFLLREAKNVAIIKQIQKTESWLRRKLKEMKVNKAEEVFYAQWQKGKLYVIKN